MSRKGGIASSGDLIVDWLFQRIVRALNNRVCRINKVRKLRDPENIRSKLTGLLLDVDDYYFEIFICADRWQGDVSDELGAIITHEVLHLILKSENERCIRVWERVLWSRFSHGQKRTLKSYIPRRFSSEKP